MWNFLIGFYTGLGLVYFLVWGFFCVLGDDAPGLLWRPIGAAVFWPVLLVRWIVKRGR
jgi:hypothetical protein